MPSGGAPGTDTSVRPSRIVSTTSLRAATSASWVTITTVVFRDACTRINRSTTSWPFLESRFPVGSSAQQDGRVVGERSRDGHSLLLTARQLRRVVMTTIGQPHLAQ